MRLARLFALGSVALLAACAGNPQARPGIHGGPIDLSADDMMAESRQQAALPAPGGTVTEPARLKGLDPLQVRSMLGMPVFTRRDAPAEIWQYRGRACTLDLFLYDEAAGTQKVAHYAVRGTQPVSERDCMDELTTRNRGVPTS